MAKMSDDDAAYLQAMIVHHQTALKMSEDYLKVGAAQRLAKVSDLARSVITAQTAEIKTMTTWLNEAGRPVKAGGRSKAGMSGMDM